MSEEYKWDTASQTKMGQYLINTEMLFLKPIIQNHQMKTCLDLGCGSGCFTEPFYNQGVAMTGIDLDSHALSLLKTKFPKVQTICMDASKKLPFKDEFFDGIISIEFVDYITDLKAFFTECARILKPGSNFVFTCGNKNSYKTFIYRFPLYQKFSKEKGRYLFSYEEIEKSLAENGFTLEEAHGYNWFPFYRFSNNLLVPLAQKIEKFLKLDRLVKKSPWIFYVARKK